MGQPASEPTSGGHGQEAVTRDMGGIQWLAWFSKLTGAISIYNIADHIWQNHSLDAFETVLRFYRAVFYPIATPIQSGIHYLFSAVGWNLIISKDVIVIYVLLIECSARANPNMEGRYSNAFMTIFWPLYIVILIGLLIAGHIAPDWTLRHFKERLIKNGMSVEAVEEIRDIGDLTENMGAMLGLIARETLIMIGIF
jgi:hypothetical protein